MYTFMYNQLLPKIVLLQENAWTDMGESDRSQMTI